MKKIETINAIDRALDLLLLLYHEESEMGIIEISKKLGVYQSTVYRTLVTLEKKGFVYQNEESSKYGLGLKLFSIGMAAGHTFSWLHLAEPYFKELSAEFEETVNVSVMDTSSKDELLSILIHQENMKKHLLGPSQIAGERTQCYCSAVGKILLAFSKEDLTERIQKIQFVKYTDHTISDWKQLMQSLELIRQQGYALDEEEQEEGLFCVAAPLFGKKNSVIAAVSISGPRNRMDTLGVERMSKKLQETLEKISNFIR